MNETIKQLVKDVRDNNLKSANEILKKVMEDKLKEKISKVVTEDVEQPVKKQSVKVTFDDGDIVVTDINGSKEEIKKYYLGKKFPTRGEKPHTAIKVEFV